MSIVFSCYSCGKKFRVKNALAGKAIKCPGCAAAIQVPGQTSAGPAASVAATAIQWYVKAQDGQTYGPITQAELDQWVAQGRVTAETQILQHGADQWQWADNLYPQLAQPRPIPAPAAATVPPVVSPAAMPSPAGLGLASSATSSEFGRETGSRKAPRSAAVNTIAMLSYAMGAIHGKCGLLLFGLLGGLLRGVLENFEDFQELHGEERVREAEFYMSIGAVIAVMMIVIAVLYFWAGYGVIKRRPWGRILCIGMGVYTAILALLDLACVVQGFRMCFPGFVICAGYSAGVFAVLFNPRFAEEFKKRRKR
jgi:hypothetical protein